MKTPLKEFYQFAENVVKESGYGFEIGHVKAVLNRPLDLLDPGTFFEQYVYVVLCSYWKEQYARKEWDLYFATGDLGCISNMRKRAAIAEGEVFSSDWLAALMKAEDKIEYLDTLPMIGPVTKYHLVDDTPRLSAYFFNLGTVSCAGSMVCDKNATLLSVANTLYTCNIAAVILGQMVGHDRKMKSATYTLPVKV